MTRTLITIEFTRGGPLDGEQLTTEWPPEAWYHVAGGYYLLVRYREPSSDFGPNDGTAYYRWEPDPGAPDLRTST